MSTFATAFVLGLLGPAILPAGTRRATTATMKILRYQAGASVEATETAIQGLIGSPGEGVFVLSFTEEGSLSNSVFDRTIGKYEASQMHGGPALACVQIVHGDGAQQDQLCELRGIRTFPHVEVWRLGKIVATVRWAFCCILRGVLFEERVARVLWRWPLIRTHASFSQCLRSGADAGEPRHALRRSVRVVGCCQG